MKKLIDKLREERTLTSEEFAHLLSHYDDEALAYINQQAREVATAHFGQGVYIRGLIEISNYCRNNCNYCGIRKSASDIPNVPSRCLSVKNRRKLTNAIL